MLKVGVFFDSVCILNNLMYICIHNTKTKIMKNNIKVSVVVTLVVLLFASLVVDTKSEQIQVNSSEIESIKPFLSCITLSNGMKIEGAGSRYWFGHNKNEVMTVIKSENIYGMVSYKLVE